MNTETDEDPFFTWHDGAESLDWSVHGGVTAQIRWVLYMRGPARSAPRGAACEHVEVKTFATSAAVGASGLRRIAR